MLKSLLLLEDDVRLRSALRDDFADRGYQVTEAGNLQEILKKIFDYAVVDVRLLGESGLRALPVLLAANPECRIVVLTGYGSIASAVEAVKLGAVNYLAKPTSADLIEAALLDQLKTKIDELENPLPSLEKHEHEYIDFVLTQNQGNVSRTAKQLGLHRQSLQRKLKKYP